AEYCHSRGMTPPATQGQTVRLVLESLAERYAKGLRALNEMLGGNTIKRLNIIGGGSLNTLLNRLTARAAGMEVIAGPVEATAIGSLLLQAETIGAIRSRSEVKRAEFHKSGQ
ncbi:MAG: rhamnulokinase, partial [Muribaculaceae bacterium]|nr:rhamnulokinase [Muribaculaceae bacterium]